MLCVGIFRDVFKTAQKCCIYKRSGVKSYKNNWRPKSFIQGCRISKCTDDFFHILLSTVWYLWDRQSTWKEIVGYSSQYIACIWYVPPGQIKRIRGVFLDVSAAFDRSSHPTIIAKLEQVKIGGSFLEIFKSDLNNRKQMVTKAQ